MEFLSIPCDIMENDINLDGLTDDIWIDKVEALLVLCLEIKISFPKMLMCLFIILNFLIFNSPKT